MSPSNATQEMLDSTQYAVDSIRQYEAVYGEDFVSPGGLAMATELVSLLQLPPGSKVLDVGCGLGGSAFVMARDFALIVDGIDLSTNMLSMAEAKRQVHQLLESVTFTEGDCLQLDCPERYDAIYSRDVFLHIHDKTRLFSVLYAALKPGGKLLFTDYCCGEKPWGDHFVEYVRNREYCLHTLPDYAELIEAAGFVEVQTRDLTSRFIEILNGDLQTIGSSGLPAQDQHQLRQSWLGKLERAESNDHRWGLFTAQKV